MKRYYLFAVIFFAFSTLRVFALAPDKELKKQRSLSRPAFQNNLNSTSQLSTGSIPPRRVGQSVGKNPDEIQNAEIREPNSVQTQLSPKDNSQSATANAGEQEVVDRAEVNNPVQVRAPASSPFWFPWGWLMGGLALLVVGWRLTRK